MSSGIYIIRNKINGHIYIGSSKNLVRRKHRHFRYLRAGTHENKHLQHAFTKYSEDAFEFITVLYTSNLLEEEQKLLDEHMGTPSCYNICGTAGSPSVVGRKKSDAWKQKISMSMKQFYENNPSHKEMLSQARRGTRLSDVVRQKMSDGHTRGSSHHNAKLTEDQVLEIKAKYSPRKYSYGKLAAEYGVDKKTIIRIIQGKTWSHI
jgi:group I intron endonuclease